MRRFSGLLGGNCESHEPWDVLLEQAPGFVVAPTKGAILPYWLLVIPRMPHLNFATSFQEEDKNPVEIVREVAGKFTPSKQWIWFEHGAAILGNDVGCGVDHAHIHLLLSPPFSLEEFRSEVVRASSSEWTHSGSGQVYEQVSGRENYYMFGGLEDAYFTSGHSLGSQFFRKTVASLVGKPQEWDYKRFDGKHNVLKTLDYLAPMNMKAA